MPVSDSVILGTSYVGLEPMGFPALQLTDGCEPMEGTSIYLGFDFGVLECGYDF